MAWFHVLEALDGQPYVLNGVSGTYKLTWMKDKPELIHVPDDSGKQSDDYRRIREALHDDWISEVTWSRSTVDAATALFGIDKVEQMCLRLM